MGIASLDLGFYWVLDSVTGKHRMVHITPARFGYGGYATIVVPGMLNLTLSLIDLPRKYKIISKIEAPASGS